MPLINRRKIKKRIKGGSVIDFTLNNIPLPEMHLLDGFKRYSFCGPFTKLQNRVELDKDGNIVKIKTQPINSLDSGCMQHDVAYEKYKDTANRNLADKELSVIANNFLKHNTSYRDKINGQIVKNIMDTKVKYRI